MILFKELYNSVYIIFDFLLSSQYTSSHMLPKENNIKQFSKVKLQEKTFSKGAKQFRLLLCTMNWA